MPQIFEAAVTEGRDAAFHSGGLILEGLFPRGEEEDQFCNCKGFGPFFKVAGVVEDVVPG